MQWLTPSPLNRTTKSTNAAVVAVLSAALFCSTGCNDEPKVKVQANRGTVAIDLQTLGEYPTTISHVRLSDKRNKATIWEIKTKSGTPQLHGLTFKLGENSVSLADPDTGTYTVLSPATSKVFQLERGGSYELEVWKREGGTPARVAIKFPN
jgi:hypothetical protein